MVLVLWLVWLVGLSARGVLGGGLVPFYVFICFHYIEKVHIVSTCSPVAVSAKKSSHSQGRVNDAKHALLYSYTYRFDSDRKFSACIIL